jgi:hypothetical protein
MPRTALLIELNGKTSYACLLYLLVRRMGGADFDNGARKLFGTAQNMQIKLLARLYAISMRFFRHICPKMPMVIAQSLLGGCRTLAQQPFLRSAPLERSA